MTENKNFGIGTRVLNFLVDTLCCLILAWIASAIWNWYVFYYHYTYLYFGIILYIILFIFYMFFEGVFSRTPGKWISFTRVIDKKTKQKAHILQIFIRTIVRMTIIDLFFIPFIGEPLHDYLSKTTLLTS